MNFIKLIHKYIAVILGALIYSFSKHISFRFLFPKKVSMPFERLRVFALKLQGAKIGKNSCIRNRSFIAYPKNLRLGSNVKIGSNSNIYNYANFQVGNGTEIGSGLYVQTNEHLWNDVSLPIAKQGSVSEDIIIGDGVYIGANVTILKGVNIASFCVVGAGAVVTNNTDSGFLYAGVPAKKIKAI